MENKAMSPELERALGLLTDKDYTCVLIYEDKVYSSFERGVKPLLQFLSSGTDFHGFSAADKVVGKAAAFLYLLLGIKELYAPVISKQAKAVLENGGVCVYCATVTEAIRNRDNTGFCPMESAVLDIDSPAEALIAIEQRLKELRSK